jgi:S1-C subfamily serine protease
MLKKMNFFIFNALLLTFYFCFNLSFCSYNFNKKHLHQDFLSYSSAVNIAALSVVSIQTTEKILHDKYFIFSDSFFQYIFDESDNVLNEMFNNNVNISDYFYEDDSSILKNSLYSNNLNKNLFNSKSEKNSDENEDLSELYQHGLGSGVLINNNGYILTNYHVIQDSCFIIAKLYSGKESEVDVIGFDTKTDLAVLKILDKNLLSDLLFIHIGNPCSLEVGDVFLAIGNPFGFDNTVTK